MQSQGHPTRSGPERVLVCGALLPGQEEEHEGPLSEARGLVAAAGGVPVGPGVVQKRDAPDPATLLGKGKVEEVARLVGEHAPDAVVVDNDLSPGQVRNLEKVWRVRVVDRSELILDIFARRARTRQARLQVELAQVEYLLPRLRRMWTHLERFEGGIGMRGPGETQLETDRRLIRRRIQLLREELAEIEERTSRQVQTRAAEYTVGLVGYTNAGKSSLLNRLTGAQEFAADMLFATLDTRTRQWKLPDGRTVLLSDTIGFLQRLPHHLVASFQATLEEALKVDLLLHVVDASHPDARAQLAAVQRVLVEAGRHSPEDVIVYNKVDRIQAPAQLDDLRAGSQVPAVSVSARTGQGLERLAQIVAERLDARSTLVEVELPLADGRSAARLRASALVVREEVEDDRWLRMVLRVAPREMGMLDAGQLRWRVIEPARDPLAPILHETEATRAAQLAWHAQDARRSRATEQ